MSNATFHRKFRQVTGFSPVQFRKRVRLFEARRLLVARETNVTSSAFAVGYVSLAQFVRDYKELFGLPPLRDIKQLHNASDDLAVDRRLIGQQGFPDAPEQFPNHSLF